MLWLNEFLFELINQFQIPNKNNAKITIRINNNCKISTTKIKYFRINEFNYILKRKLKFLINA